MPIASQTCEIIKEEKGIERAVNKLVGDESADGTSEAHTEPTEDARDAVSKPTGLQQSVRTIPLAEKRPLLARTRMLYISLVMILKPYPRERDPNGTDSSARRTSKW